jgi:F-type H+-transporting ATPase subunit b
MDSLIHTFHIDWKLILAQVINFGVVILVLYKFGLKPLKKLMDERGATIKGGLENADRAQALLAAQEVEYEQALATARAEAALIMKEVKADAEKKRSELLATAHSEAQSILIEGKKQLEQEKAVMLDSAKQELVGIVMKATEKVVGTTLAGNTNTTLVEESLRDIAHIK